MRLECAHHPAESYVSIEFQAENNDERFERSLPLQDKERFD